MSIEFMLAVAILSVDIMTQDHQGFKPPDQFHLPLQNAVICMVVGSFGQVHGIKIPGRTQDRVMPDAQCPQTVQPLVIPEGFVVVVGHKGSLNRQTFFHGVIAEHRAEEQNIVISMGG